MIKINNLGASRFHVSSDIEKGPCVRQDDQVSSRYVTATKEINNYLLHMCGTKKIFVGSLTELFFCHSSLEPNRSYDDTVRSRYIAVISLLNNSRKTPHSPPVRARYVVSWVSEWKVWTEFWHFNFWAVCTIVSYMAVIYRESIVPSYNLNRCWPSSNDVTWCSSESHFAGNFKDIDR